MATKKANSKTNKNTIVSGDRMAEYLAKMDFQLLKKQKTALINMQTKIENGKKLSQADHDVLEGMINFCDSIQDIAVDEYNYPERSVYRRTRKDI